MPQLDFFTLLFQFKSFFVFFFLIYVFFLFVFVPRLHLVISVRRSQVLNLLSYYNFLKFVVYSSFAWQSFLFRNNFHFFNELFVSLFNRYLDSKFSISHFLFVASNL